MSISPGLDGFLEVLSGGAETFNNPGEGWIHCKVPTTPGFQRYPSDEKDAFNYFSTLSPQRERLYRQILAKAKEAGLLVCEFNPDEVDLYEVLSHSGNSRTLRIDDIALGPCDYEPNDLSAQIILRCHPEHKQVGESEVWCIFSNQFALQGETNILKFSRNDDGLLTLKEKVLVSMS
jgi:hypothetical protein